LIDREDGALGRPWDELFDRCQRVSLAAFADGEHLLFTREPDQAFQVTVRRCRGLGAAADVAVVMVEECAHGGAGGMAEIERAISLGQIAAEFAHELNNSLTTVLGWLQLLEDDLTGDEDSRESLQVLREEIQRASRKVVSLLAMSRGKTVGSPQRLDVPAMLAAVIMLVEPKLADAEIRLIRRLEPVSPVLGLEDELKQVFLNLLLNAIKAIDGGGTIEVACDSPDSGHVCISVRDTGCGIPAEALERVFDAYFTTRAQVGGTGLGLFVAREIVCRHNGELRVESVPGKGSTFSVILPAGT